MIARKMGRFVVSAAVNVRVGKNIKQPAGRGEYRSDTYIYWVGPLCSGSRSPTLSYSTVSKEGGDVVCVEVAIIRVGDRRIKNGKKT